MQQARVIKNRDGNVLTDARSVTGRWKDYFVRRALKRTKSGKTVGPDTCGDMKVFRRGATRVFN